MQAGKHNIEFWNEGGILWRSIIGISRSSTEGLCRWFLFFVGSVSAKASSLVSKKSYFFLSNSWPKAMIQGSMNFLIQGGFLFKYEAASKRRSHQRTSAVILQKWYGFLTGYRQYWDSVINRINGFFPPPSPKVSVRTQCTDLLVEQIISILVKTKRAQFLTFTVFQYL